MEFTIVFWNIWLESQMNGAKRSSRLLAELDKIIKDYNPDCIGLNEAMQKVGSKEPFVLTHLKRRGYKYVHFAMASPYTDQWNIGAAMVSKYPLQDLDEIVMGKDTFARWRGYDGYTVKAIGAKITKRKKSVQVICAHPLALKPVGLPEHWKNQKVLRETVKQKRYKQVILGGDFNEYNTMPFSFARREKDRFHMRSGTYKNATWSHNGGGMWWMRCNLDKLFWTKEKTTELLEFKVLDTKVSDHRPLLGRFKVS